MWFNALPKHQHGDAWFSKITLLFPKRTMTHNPAPMPTLAAISNKELQIWLPTVMTHRRLMALWLCLFILGKNCWEADRIALFKPVCLLWKCPFIQLFFFFFFLLGARWKDSLRLFLRQREADGRKGVEEGDDTDSPTVVFANVLVRNSSDSWPLSPCPPSFTTA